MPKRDEEQLDFFEASFNYEVFVNGRSVGKAETSEQVSALLGKRPFGSTYSVKPLKEGVDVSEFIPY